MTDNTVLSPNSAIDSSIKQMLPSFSDTSQRRIRKAILDAKRAAEKHRDENTDAEARHAFRELIPAYVLNQKGFTLEYHQPIHGKTPDWLDSGSRLMVESYTYERGGRLAFAERVSSVAAEKCLKYKDILVANHLRFVLTVYIDFESGADLEDCLEASETFRSLLGDLGSLFAIVFFSETYFIGRTQKYRFISHHRASLVADLPNWPFPPDGLDIAVGT
jgi:hypothetical protein